MEPSSNEVVRDELVSGVVASRGAGTVAGTGTMRQQMWRVFRQNKLALASLAFVVILILGAVIYPFFFNGLYWKSAPIDLANTCFNSTAPGYTGSAPPSAHHWLGCIKGYDTIGLLFYSGRFSLGIGFLSAIVTMSLGVTYGMLSGYIGGKLDAILMRIVDMMLSIPGLDLLILTIVLFGRSFVALTVVIGFTGWFGVARLMRAETQSLRERDYVAAAITMGASRQRIIYRHILPNAMSTMVTAGTFALGDAILALAGIGFLGLGLQPPQFDWGTLIQRGSDVFKLGYWWTIWPIAALFILFVLSTNYIGDAMRDAFEVRLQEQ